MNNLKRVLLFFGVVLAVVVIALLVKNVIDINQLAVLAGANRSAVVLNPNREVLLSAGLALLSGLFLGLGLALHSGPGRAERERPSPHPNHKRP